MSGVGGDLLPRVKFYVHLEHELPGGFDLQRVVSIGPGAVAEAMRVAKAGAPLAGLEEIEVTLVSDGIIAAVHVDFMAIDGATDVITFDHGEIVISTETAAVQAVENGNSIERETALYVVHGLLHLAGYADKTDTEFTQMAEIQAEILAKVF
ncbi:MAG: putative rRNA maturation factor [Verrucomicrobiales bacterium]|jgi:probable rRNA maturation factor